MIHPKNNMPHIVVNVSELFTVMQRSQTDGTNRKTYIRVITHPYVILYLTSP